MTKEQFIAELLKRKIKTRFMKNLKLTTKNANYDFWETPRTIDTLIKKVDYLTWHTMLLCAFYWRETPEEHQFWENICDKDPE